MSKKTVTIDAESLAALLHTRIGFRMFSLCGKIEHALTPEQKLAGQKFFAETEEIAEGYGILEDFKKSHNNIMSHWM